MEYIRGKTSAEIDADGLAAGLAGFSDVLIDIGTGDGRYVLHVARTRPTWFALGVDACRENGVEGVREIVRRRIRQGANVIKVGLSKGGVDDKYHPWGDDPYNEVASYSLEEIRALIDEAHLNKLKVSAHCIGDEAVRNALDGGVDVIEHGYGITEETRKRLVERNALLVSTISQLHFHQEAAIPYHYPDWLQRVFKRHTEAMRADFERSLELGVRYALGTDLLISAQISKPQILLALCNRG